MSLDFLFILFFYFTHKQIYAGTHFTGASVVMKNFISTIGILNLILSIAFLVSFTIKFNFLHTVILFVASLIVMLIMNRSIAKVAIGNLISEGCDPNSEYFLSMYNNKCDVFSTIIAEIGIVANVVIIILYFVF